MPDIFDTDYVSLTAPAVSHYIVIPTDVADLPQRPRALYVNAAGTAVMEDAAGEVISYELTAGTVLAIRPTRIRATGTTAQLIAWY
ncbi:MAG: hypothetical protein AAFU41_04890 [Pseudomonadota bacterium]